MIWLLPKGDLLTTHLPLAAALGQEQVSHQLSNLSIKEISEKKATPMVGAGLTDSLPHGSINGKNLLLEGDSFPETA